MKKIVAAHNRKVLSAKIHEEMDPCNCRGGVKKCPLQGKCRIKSIVYQVDVEVPGQPVKTYFGQTIYFKTRYYQHMVLDQDETPLQTTARIPSFS